MKTRKFIKIILAAIITGWAASLIANCYHNHARYVMFRKGPPPGYCILQDEDGKYIIGLKRFSWHHYGAPFNGPVDYIYNEPWMISTSQYDALVKAWHHYETEKQSEADYRAGHVQGEVTPVNCSE